MQNRFSSTNMINRLLGSAAVVTTLTPVVDANLLYRLLNNDEFDWFDAVVDDPVARTLSGRYSIGEMISDNPQLNPFSYLPDWVLIAVSAGMLIGACAITCWMLCDNEPAPAYSTSHRQPADHGESVTSVIKSPHMK